MNFHSRRPPLQRLFDAARSSPRDPTGTTQLRSRFRADAQRRLSTLRSVTHTMLVERDALGYRSMVGIDIFSLPHDPGHSVDEFMRWFTAAADSKLVADQWWTPHLNRAFNSGITAGARLLKREQFMPLALPALYGAQVERELDGLVAALVQQVSRVLAQSALQRVKAPILYRQVLSAIKKVGVVRLDALANSQVVLLHNVGRLAIFNQMGVERVGTVPEWLPASSGARRRAHDAHFHDRTREQIATEKALREMNELLERQRAQAAQAAARAEAAAEVARAALARQVEALLAGKEVVTATKAAAQAELEAARAAARAEVAAEKAATAARTLEAKEAWETVKQARRTERLGMTAAERAAERRFSVPTPKWTPPAGYQRVAEIITGAPSIPERLLGIGSEFLSVLTAGDDKVCAICEEISADSPYSLLEAQGLLPAHPNCRCAFIPTFDERFAPIEQE